MKLTTTLLLLMLAVGLQAQTSYFPTNTNWDTVSTESLGWCPDSLANLNTYLESKGTKAFIVLDDGKIALEWYYGTFTADSFWYWASAGKTVTATLIGIAQQEGYLDINDTTSQYLGPGWTSCATTDEEKITIRHQLSMTTGLDYNYASLDCTDDTCLVCLNDPGTEWFYHNAPYTLLTEVLENATGKNANLYFQQKIGSKIGASGLFYTTSYNEVFYSTPRDMARFGLMILNKGLWNGTPVLSDTTYYNQMVNTSQSINEAYGYLWWLNGKSTFRLPTVTNTFSGHIIPNAPADMFSGLGKNDQKVYVVPSQNRVIIRMGNDAGGTALALNGFDNELWGKISGLENCPVGISETQPLSIQLYPNPVSDKLMIDWQPAASATYSVKVYNVSGEVVTGGPLMKSSPAIIPMPGLPEGIYLVRITGSDGTQFVQRVMVE